MNNQPNKKETLIASTQIQERSPKDSANKGIAVGLSACLAGQTVRYNGGHSQSKLCLNQLSDHFDFKTFCPEVAAGFGTPRPTMRLMGTPENPKLVFSNDHSQDLTQQLRDGYTNKLSSFADLDGYILMKKFPSCGLERIKIYQENGYAHETRSKGLFTADLQKQYPLLPIEEEGRLHDPQLYENFMLRVYAHHYFRTEVLNQPSLHNLITFHSRYKYVLMAHNQQAYKELGRLIAGTPKTEAANLINEYFPLFMKALAKPANRRNHTNTLLHLLGYLKKTVPSKARQHITNIIHNYRKGQLPLITPLMLLKHYFEQYGSDYIKSQRYLEPYPEVLGLSNRI